MFFFQVLIVVHCVTCLRHVRDARSNRTAAI